MIQLQINAKTLISEIDNKLSGIKELTAPTVLQEIAKAAFTITGERFMIDADNYSRNNPKKMHHVYDWGGIGKPFARLFILERSRILSGSLQISAKFIASKLPVPIPAELQTPGSNGRSVTSKNIFRNKAQVMEDGQAITYNARKMLAFLGTEGIVFVAPGTTINIEHPGGISTKNAFAEYFARWYSDNAQTIMNSSGIYEKIVDSAANALNRTGSGIAEVRKAVANTVASTVGDRSIIV